MNIQRNTWDKQDYEHRKEHMGQTEIYNRHTKENMGQTRIWTYKGTHVTNLTMDIHVRKCGV